MAPREHSFRRFGSLPVRIALVFLCLLCGATPGRGEGVQTQFSTEWLWLVTSRDEHLARLDRELSAKYREALGIPVHATVGVQQWMQEGEGIAITIAAQDVRQDRGVGEGSRTTVIPYTACVAAARAEFGARCRSLDDALARSFSNWTTKVSWPEASSVAGIWQAAEEIRMFRAVHYGTSATPFGSRMTDVAMKLVEKGIDKFFDLKPDFSDATVLSRLAGYAWTKGADAAADFVKDKITGEFRSVLCSGNHKALDGLAASLTAWADCVIEEVAWPRPRRAGDFRGLGTNEVFNTGLACRLAPEMYVDRRFGERRFAGHVFSASVVLKLEAGGSVSSVEFGGDATTVRTLTRADVPDFPEWLADVRKYEQEAERLGSAGEAQWKSKFNGTDPAVALSAMRLLVADVRAIIAADSFTAEVRSQAIKKLTTMLVTYAAPGLSVLTGFLTSCADAGVDVLAPNNLKNLLAGLDRISATSALGLARLPVVPLVFPGGDGDVAKLMRPNPQLPGSCGPKAKLSEQRFICKGPVFTGPRDRLTATATSISYSEEIKDERTGETTTRQNTLSWGAIPLEVRVDAEKTIDITTTASGNEGAKVSGWFNSDGIWQGVRESRQGGTESGPDERLRTKTMTYRIRGGSRGGMLQMSGGHEPGYSWVLITWTFEPAPDDGSSESVAGGEAGGVGRDTGSSGPGKQTAKEAPAVSEADRTQAKRLQGRGNALAEQEMWPDAERVYRESLRLDPTADDIWENLSEACVEQGKWEEAVAALREAVRLVPREAGYHRQLATALRGAGRGDEAAKEIEEAERIEKALEQEIEKAHGR